MTTENDPLTTKWDDALVHRVAVEIMGWHLRVVDRDAEAYGAPVRMWFDKDGGQRAWADPFIDNQRFDPFKNVADAVLLFGALHGRFYLVQTAFHAAGPSAVDWAVFTNGFHTPGNTLLTTGASPTLPQAARQIMEACFADMDAAKRRYETKER